MSEILTKINLFRRNNIPDIKISTSQVRPMTKLITRLIKQHDLSPELCPHLNMKRSEGAIQFLIHKRYIDGTLSKYTLSLHLFKKLFLFNNINLYISIF